MLISKDSTTTHNQINSVESVGSDQLNFGVSCWPIVIANCRCQTESLISSLILAFYFGIERQTVVDAVINAPKVVISEILGALAGTGPSYTSRIRLMAVIPLLHRGLRHIYGHLSHSILFVISPPFFFFFLIAHFTFVFFLLRGVSSCCVFGVIVPPLLWQRLQPNLLLPLHHSIPPSYTSPHTGTGVIDCAYFIRLVVIFDS